MKVLFIISTLQAGGAERVMSLLASYFAKFHDVTLLKFDTKPPFYELDERIKLIDLPLPMVQKGSKTADLTSLSPRWTALIST